jgi:DNA polymerase-3 subunit epsilon
LKTICAAHGLGWDDRLAHSAEYDTLQASRAVVRMARRCAMPYPKLVSLGYSKSDAGVMRKYVEASEREMHDRQIGWYADQANSLREYFLKKANNSTPDEAAELRESAASITTRWPV